jgi:hypothetical protein
MADPELILTISENLGEDSLPIFATSDRQVIAAVVDHLATRLGHAPRRAVQGPRPMRSVCPPAEPPEGGLP